MLLPNAFIYIAYGEDTPAYLRSSNRRLYCCHASTHQTYPCRQVRLFACLRSRSQAPHILIYSSCSVIVLNPAIISLACHRITTVQEYSRDLGLKIQSKLRGQIPNILSNNMLLHTVQIKNNLVSWQLPARTRTRPTNNLYQTTKFP